MKYSEFKLDWEPVQRVFLTGDMPSQDDFIAKIEAGVRIPVEAWNPLKGLVLKSKQVKALLDSNPTDAARLAPSLGLALRRG
jgi:Tfp pilus assembly PilM family ATPase